MADLSGFYPSASPDDFQPMPGSNLNPGGQNQYYGIPPGTGPGSPNIPGGSPFGWAAPQYGQEQNPYYPLRPGDAGFNPGYGEPKFTMRYADPQTMAQFGGVPGAEAAQQAAAGPTQAGPGQGMNLIQSTVQDAQPAVAGAPIGLPPLNSDPIPAMPQVAMPNWSDPPMAGGYAAWHRQQYGGPQVQQQQPNLPPQFQQPQYGYGQQRQHQMAGPRFGGYGQQHSGMNYDDWLGLYHRTRNALNSYSGQGQADINARYDKQVQQQKLQQVNSGMVGSNIGNAPQQAVNQQRDASLNRFNDSLVQQRIADDTRLMEMKPYGGPQGFYQHVPTVGAGKTDRGSMGYGGYGQSLMTSAFLGEKIQPYGGWGTNTQA